MCGLCVWIGMCVFDFVFVMCASSVDCWCLLCGVFDC